MASSNSLEGMTALITGSGGGMGRSHAVLMSERGADIIVHDIKEDGAAETAEMVQKNGRKASVLIADVRDVPDFTAKIKAAEGEHGKIDILVNNAGVSGKHRMIDEIDEEIFDEMFGIQVRGAFFATKTVVEGMKQRKAGRIITISSIYAMGGSDFASHYSAAKARAFRLHKKLGTRTGALSHTGQCGGARIRPDRYDAWQQYARNGQGTGRRHAAGAAGRPDRYFLCGRLARLGRNRNDFRSGHQPKFRRSDCGVLGY